MKGDENNKKIILKKLLAEYIGTEDDDIHEDDSLRDDLHMSASDLSDFAQILSDKGFDIHDLNLLEVDSVQDLFDSIIHEEL